MDYGQVKAVINARMEQWKKQKELAETLHADEFLVIALEACVHVCKLILQDLETAHDILEKQG